MHIEIEKYEKSFERNNKPSFRPKLTHAPYQIRRSIEQNKTKKQKKKKIKRGKIKKIPTRGEKKFSKTSSSSSTFAHRFRFIIKEKDDGDAKSVAREGQGTGEKTTSNQKKKNVAYF